MLLHMRHNNTMRPSAICIGLLAIALASAADKKLPIETSSNELVEITATPILDKEQIRQELGSDLGGSIILVRVRVRPLSEKPFKIDRDDFALISDKDGQRSTPYAPTQIAGSGTLVVSSTGTRGSMTGQNNGPIWGGVPGIGGGRPQRLPGNNSSAGNSAGPTAIETKVEPGEKSADNTESPLLTALKQKVLPEKEVIEPISGLLYFQIEGKIKPKDLELYYKTPAGRLGLRFRP